MIGDFVLELMSTKSTQEATTMDRGASAGFEGIAQMLLEQKKLMDALEAENRELRRQLADLRRGVGIAIVIEGKTIQLATETNTSSQAALQSLQSLQGTPNTPPVSVNSTYSGNSRTTGAQQQVNLNSEKRENGTSRNPLADSFVL
jgi:hypothetical protein